MADAEQRECFMPSLSRFGSILFLAPSGSGKTHMMCEFIKNYRLFYHNRQLKMLQLIMPESEQNSIDSLLAWARDNSVFVQRANAVPNDYESLGWPVYKSGRLTKIPPPSSKHRENLTISFVDDSFSARGGTLCGDQYIIRLLRATLNHTNSQCLVAAQTAVHAAVAEVRVMAFLNAPQSTMLLKDALKTGPLQDRIDKVLAVMKNLFVKHRHAVFLIDFYAPIESDILKFIVFHKEKTNSTEPELLPQPLYGILDI